MEQIASGVFPYIAAVIGFLIVHVLNGIKSEITEVKTTIHGLERDFREGITSLDRRVSMIEARCQTTHQP